jgi:hypothetical protein
MAFLHLRAHETALSPEQILAGYVRAVEAAESGESFSDDDNHCLTCVTQLVRSLGPSGTTLLRIAKYRYLHGSLHGFRIGTVSASVHRMSPFAAKGRTRAEYEFADCVEAAYEKWCEALLQIARS